MNKTKKVIIIFLICALSFSGCWSHNELDTIDIVAGFAIDIDEESGQYMMTYEMVDTLSSGSGRGDLKIKYASSTGETIFEAVRNAKKKLSNKPYGGNMQTIVISSEIARTQGINPVLEQIMRDGEPRETLSIVISQEKTAKEVLLAREVDAQITSYAINQIIKEDSSVTSSTIYVPLYKVHSALNGSGDSLLLPAVHLVEVEQMDEERYLTTEINGIAVFDEDKLIDFISPEQSKYCLFILNKVSGGSFYFPYKTQSGDFVNISMEIRDSKTKTAINYIDNQLVIDADISVITNLADTQGEVDLLIHDERVRLEDLARKALKQSIGNFFLSVQQEFGIDIFGFGHQLYQKNPKLWYELENDWNEIFSTAQYNINIELENLNTGVIENY